MGHSCHDSCPPPPPFFLKPSPPMGLHLLYSRCPLRHRAHRHCTLSSRVRSLRCLCRTSSQCHRNARRTRPLPKRSTPSSLSQTLTTRSSLASRQLFSSQASTAVPLMFVPAPPRIDPSSAQRSPSSPPWRPFLRPLPSLPQLPSPSACGGLGRSSRTETKVCVVSYYTDPPPHTLHLRDGALRGTKACRFSTSRFRFRANTSASAMSCAVTPHPRCGSHLAPLTEPLSRRHPRQGGVQTKRVVAVVAAVAEEHRRGGVGGVADNALLRR
jgi:hypothetical protein